MAYGNYLRFAWAFTTGSMFTLAYIQYRDTVKQIYQRKFEKLYHDKMYHRELHDKN